MPVIAPSDVQFSELHGVSIRTQTGWPGALKEGYYPILLDLENKSKDERRLSIEASRHGNSWTTRYTSRSRVVLGPGERRRIELIMPAFEVESDSYGYSSGMSVSSVRVTTLQLRLNESDDQYNANFSMQEEPGDSHSILVTSRRALASSDLEMVGDFFDDNEARVFVSGLVADDLPGRMEPYTSLSAVVVELGHGMLTESELAPVLTWVRLGGTLVFMGKDAEAQARSLSLVRPWMEDRFLRLNSELKAWSMGLGAVVICDPTDADDWGSVASWVLADNQGIEPQRNSGRWTKWPELDALGELPYRGFGVLMLLFAILVGPANFITLKKMKREVLLLITIPTIALLSTGAVLFYGIIYQGLDVKSAEYSMTVLDQRTHQSSSVALRKLYAGLATRGGILPGPGTVCLPNQFGREGRGYGAFSSSTSDYLINMSGGVSLTASYLPARVPVEVLIGSDAPARLRVGVEKSGESFEISNELTAEIEEFVLIADDGSHYALESSCLPGERSVLVPTTEESAAALLNWFEQRKFRRWGDPLAEGSYLAILAENPFVDDCELNSIEYEGKHLIFGVLGDEVWR